MPDIDKKPKLYSTPYDVGIVPVNAFPPRSMKNRLLRRDNDDGSEPTKLLLFTLMKPSPTSPAIDDGILPPIRFALKSMNDSFVN